MKISKGGATNILLIALCCFSINYNSQESGLSKEKKKQVIESERFRNFEELGRLLESKSFVFQTALVKSPEWEPERSVDCVINIDSSVLTIKSVQKIFKNYESSSPYYIEYKIENWKLSQNSHKMRYSIKMEGTSDLVKDIINIKLNADKSGRVNVRYASFFGNLRY